MESNARTVLDNLRDVCKEKGITLTKACEMSGVKWDTMIDWGNHKPTAVNLLKMANALEVDPMDLIEGVN